MKPEKKQIHFFNIDNELVYWNFFLDFGPLNLGQLARFSQKLNDKLRKFPVVCFYSNTVPAKRANAIFLICAWQLLHLDRSPQDAYRGFGNEIGPGDGSTSTSSTGSQPPVSNSQGAVTIAPLPSWQDASPCQCTYDLTVMDCLQGMAKARTHGFLDFATFDVEEYEYYEQVEVRCSLGVRCVCLCVEWDCELQNGGAGEDERVRLTITFVSTILLFFATERRLELARQGQDSGLCRTLVPASRFSRGILHSKPWRLHSLLSTQKCRSRGASQQESLRRARLY